MKTIYFAKKNPELPNSPDNWIEMTSAEYCRFLETPEGKRREANFTQLDACDLDDDLLFFECSPEEAREIRSDKDHHDYLKEQEDISGYTIISYHGIDPEEEELSGEDLLKDESVNVEEEAISNLISENLHSCCNQLKQLDQHLLNHLFFSKSRMVVSSYAEFRGISKPLVCYHKRRIMCELHIKLSLQYGITEAAL